MARVSFFAGSKSKGKMRADAAPLTAAELIRVRVLLEEAKLDEHLDPEEVARRLGLDKRTVLELARQRELGRVWKPSPNRVRIPVSGVLGYIQRRAVLFLGADPGTEEGAR